MKQSRVVAIVVITTCTLIFGHGPTAMAQHKVTLHDFYRPFTLSEITPKNIADMAVLQIRFHSLGRVWPVRHCSHHGVQRACKADRCG